MWLFKIEVFLFPPISESKWKLVKESKCNPIYPMESQVKAAAEGDRYIDKKKAEV